MRVSLYSVYILIILNFRSSSSAKPIVNTRNGRVSGKTLKSLMRGVKYHTFLGIPFAAPPLKDFRFLPPQPLEPWDDVLPATKEKTACAQFNTNVKKGQGLGVYGDEDCLYLDVFTPNIEKSNPVLAFLYNDQFRNSYNKTKDYSPEFFIEEGIVIVTIAHRLSVFGFLTTEDDFIPPNAGLKDIVAGLQWVKENIASFGGNPDRVTLAGSLGGAVATDLLIHSKAKSLFQSAILQSGSAMSSLYLQESASERAFKFAEVLGKNPSNSKSLLNDLKDTTVEKLLKKEWDAIPKDYSKQTQNSLLGFGPIIEKEPGLLTEYPEDKAKEANIPILIGFNSREGLEASLQYLIEPKYLSFIEKDFPLQIPKRVNFKFDPLKDTYYTAVQDVKDFYFTKGKVNIKKPAEYITYMTDILTYSVHDTVKKYSKDVYFYYFDYFSSLNENKINLLKVSSVKDGTWGAAAGDEMCYLFKCPDLIKEYKELNRSKSKDINVQRKLVKMWANFVKFGNPTPEGETSLDGLNWKPYSTETKDYLHIGKTIEMKTDLHRERFGFWDRFIEEWGRLVVNGVVSEIGRNNKNEL